MKRRPTKLEVQPVRKTYRPKYPSYWDKNPLENPAAYPYPFSQKMLQVLSATGFTGALLLSTLSGCDTPKKGAPSAYTSGDSHNPFPVAATNLPYTPTSFGTGLPSRLKSEDAIDLINRAFQKEGLEMKYDTMVEVNGIRVPANAYNEQYRLGYVWIDYGNHGTGMTTTHPWNKPVKASQRETEKYYRKVADQYWDIYLEDSEKYIKRYISGDYSAGRDFQRALKDTLPTIEGQKAQKKYFEEQYIEYSLRSQQQHFAEASTPYEEMARQIGERITNPLSAYALTYRFQISLNWFHQEGRVGQPFMEALNRELTQIKNTANKRIWRKRMEALMSLLNEVDHHYFVREGNPVLEALREVLLIEDWRKRSQQMDKVQKLMDERLVDFSEMEKMEQMAAEGEAFIAPISTRDDRTIINEVWGDYPQELHERQRELFQQHKAAKTEAEKDSIYQLQLSLQQEVRQHQEAYRDSINQVNVQQLEDDVRQYIQWAKAQQGY